VIVDPAPVIVRQVPVVQAAPVAQPSYQSDSQPTAQLQEQLLPPRPVPASQSSAPPAALNQNQLDIDNCLRLLADRSERVREDAALSLGRARVSRAVDPLAATLAGDSSPTVREAAARALGLIGSSKALPALRRAAQVDSDRDVRRSAQFAIEVVQLAGQ
jgi:HEAT repeat protein